MTAATNNLVEQLNAAYYSTGLSAALNGDEITLFARNSQELTIDYKTKQEIESTFNTATTKNINAGSCSANVNVVLHANDVVVGRTYALALDAGSSAIGAKTVTYTAQTGDNAQAIMRGYEMLCGLQTRALVANAQTLDADSVAGTLTIADDLNYGDAAISFEWMQPINNVFGDAATYTMDAGRLQRQHPSLPTASRSSVSLFRSARRRADNLCW